MDADSQEKLNAAAAALARARRVTVLSGAGISAESGVPTFRGAGGLWEGHSLEEVATPEGFARNPKLVWQFYNERRSKLAHVEPNPGHLALAELERRKPEGTVTIVTQNVDGLHQAAGSRNVLEIHGSIRRVRCTSCRFVADRDIEPLGELPRCPKCDELLRPDVVWFGEMLPRETWTQAEAAAQQCDCFLVVGTSAVVYPAAGLIGLAKHSGAFAIEVNLEPTDASHIVDVALHGKAGEILPQLLAACTEQAER